jgi:hypothetical protein
MATILLPIEEPPRPVARRFALWDLGFRPFYLGAAASGYRRLCGTWLSRSLCH